MVSQALVLNQKGKRGGETIMKKGVTFIVVLAIIAGTIFFYLNSKGDIGVAANYPRTYKEYKNNPDWNGEETNPIVSPVYFTGKIRQAYAAAVAIPDVLDHLYCYCYCAEDHGHKSLRTCFTDGHGSGCDICMDEAIRARQLHEKGYSIKEIRAKIDKEYYRPYN